MPIINKKSSLPITPTPNPPQIKSPVVVSNIVDTKQTPLTHLVTNIEGSKWVVDLYTQVIGTNDSLTGLDVGQAGVYQQYKLIKGFEFKVANGLTTSQDPESKSMNVTGSAHCHSLVIVNQGDVFLADVGSGKLGLFQITLSEQKSMFSDTVYYIEYSLIEFVNSNSPSLLDLNSKIVNTFNYVKDFINYGQNPLVADSEFTALQKLQDLQKSMINEYYRWFYNVDRKTILMPGQSVGIYDHYLTKFVLAILNNEDHQKVIHTKVYNVDDDLYLNEPTLLDAILNRNQSILQTCVRKTGIVSTRLFTKDAMLDGIRYSMVPYIVYPKDTVAIFGGIKRSVEPKILDSLPIEEVPSPIGSLNSLVTNTNVSSNGGPIIKQVLIDDNYILSSNFYEGGEELSKLEYLIKQFLLNNSINAVELLEVGKNFYNWGGLERFYYMPLIIAMTKYVLFRA